MSKECIIRTLESLKLSDEQLHKLYALEFRSSFSLNVRRRFIISFVEEHLDDCLGPFEEWDKDFKGIVENTLNRLQEQYLTYRKLII
jgi:hypothetical protein